MGKGTEGEGDRGEGGGGGKRGLRRVGGYLVLVPLAQQGHRGVRACCNCTVTLSA